MTVKVTLLQELSPISVETQEGLFLSTLKSHLDASRSKLVLMN